MTLSLSCLGLTQTSIKMQRQIVKSCCMCRDPRIKSEDDTGSLNVRKTV